MTTVAIGQPSLTENKNSHLAQTPVSLTFAVKTDEESLPTRVQGAMGLQNLTQGSYCFLLPYNSADYGQLRGRSRLEIATRKYSKVIFSGGHTTIFDQKVDYLAPDIIKVRTNGSPIELSFDSYVPRAANSDPENWFYDGFHPILLKSCPTTEDEVKPAPVRLRGQGNIPAEWDFAGPGDSKRGRNHVEIDFIGQRVAFALAKGYKTHTLIAANTPVILKYHNDEFLQLVATLTVAIEHIKKYFGDYPFPTLTVVETTEVQRNDLPGIIALNKPRQGAFETLQMRWLNWRHWILTNLIAYQWFGASIQPHHKDDSWLIDGFAEFATLESLNKTALANNLIKPLNNGYRVVSLTYLQVQEISAAYLNQSTPFTALTTTDFTSKNSHATRHPLAFIKHAIALRQLKWQAGENKFMAFLRTFAARSKHTTIKPIDFLTHINKVPSPFPMRTRQNIRNQLEQWWSKDGWPDLSLINFSREPLPDGRWLAKAEVSQEGEISAPVSVTFTDSSGKEYRAFGKPEHPSQDVAVAQHIVDDYPEWVTIDANHKIFDTDRFNNTSRWPPFSFFPGSAKTLQDDGYTVFWAPYAFRRPAESLSYAVQGVILKYIQSGLFFNVEYAPSDDTAGFMLRKRYPIPRYGLKSEILILQNYDADRSVDFSLIRSPLFSGTPKVSLLARIRNKRNLGTPATNHFTFVSGVGVSPSFGQTRCGYNIATDVEFAPKGLAQDFSYTRNKFGISGHCGVGRRVDFDLRLFYGKSQTQGPVPESALFKPTDLKEAKLRLDVRGIARVNEIGSLNSELLFPLVIPIPADTLILSRQLRWRLFYDYGRSFTPTREFRAAGIGMLLPFGGDLAGAGSLAISRLSVLGILYTNNDGETSRKPRFLFDFKGEL